jgi:hypothetical protein
MPRRFAAALLAAALATAAAPAEAAPADDFQALLAEHYAWLLSESPTYATALGVRDHDARIEDVSLAAADRRAARARPSSSGSTPSRTPASTPASAPARQSSAARSRKASKPTASSSA